MPKRVLDVGNCGPDHRTLSHYLTSHFDVEIVQADGPHDALEHLKRGDFDLVLVNRKLDQDYSDGIEVIRLIKGNPDLAYIPAMLLTNYPEHQDAAVEIGAVRGFGKLEYHLPETKAKLAAVLEDSQ